ncbi:MAG: DUF1831 domain-containing protein [Streptococcaceae bacterium]|jgi:hypothetical protein|nr:DUF1831 domain-containing protein [Streptococcaceae bacterium]
MAFLTKVTVSGSKYFYRLADNVKRFTLRDSGFLETKAGNFQFLRPIEKTPQAKNGFMLKITVAKDLKSLKLAVTSKDGMRTVNLFKDEKNKMIQDKFYFLLDGLVERGVLSKEAAN